MFKIQKKELDLLAAYNRKEGPSQLSRILKLVGVPLVIVLIFGGVYLYLFISNNHIQGKIDDMKLSNEEIQLKIDVIDKSPYNELSVLEGTYSSLESIDNYLSSLPEITKKQITDIKSHLLSGMSITSITFSQESKQIALNCRSLNVQNIEKYISNLKAKTDMENITYTGYQESSQSNTTSTGEFDPFTGQEITTTTETSFYNFNIVISLEGGV